MKKIEKQQLLENFNIYDVLDEYSLNDDIFEFDENDKGYILKKIINEELNETERRIILTYAEFGDLRNTAKIFKVSTSTIRNEIVKIRYKIYRILLNK